LEPAANAVRVTRVVSRLRMAAEARSGSRMDAGVEGEFLGNTVEVKSIQGMLRHQIPRLTAAHLDPKKSVSMRRWGTQRTHSGPVNLLKIPNIGQDRIRSISRCAVTEKQIWGVLSEPPESRTCSEAYQASVKATQFSTSSNSVR
jgi:hypothetical protein